MAQILGRPDIEPFLRIKTITTNYTVVRGDAGYLILVNTTGGAVTVSLPALSTVGDGFVVSIKRITAGANALTIDPNGAETIEGAATLSMATQYQSVNLVSLAASGWLLGSTAVPLGRQVIAGSGLTGGGTLGSDVTLSATAATDSSAGIVELATASEAQGRTATDRALTPVSIASIGFLDLIDTVNTSSGGTVTSSTLPVSQTIAIFYSDISGNSTAALQCSISDDNGSNWSGNFMPTGSQSAAYERSGSIWITNTGASGNKITHVTLGSAGDASFRTAVISTITGVIDKVRFQMSAGSFDGGTAYIFGML